MSALEGRKVLVLGGTRFVGAAIVDELRQRGADITVMSRGVTNPEMHADLDRVRGDRTTDLGRLGDRQFDVVIDSCGYTPAQIEPAAQLAARQGAFYVFVSSGSVYDLEGHDGSVDEDHPLMAMDPDHAVDDEANYGAAKVLCEARLREVVGDRLAILRAGLLAGPRDYMDRYPYWVLRLREGGRVLVPGDGDDPAQLIDARDFAGFATDLAGSATPGIFNVTAPVGPASFADLMASTAPADADCELVWAGAEFLAEHEVSPWADMPCWVPRDHRLGAILRMDLSRAIAAGLTTRPWTETAEATHRWMQADGRGRPLDQGLSREREGELLAALAR